MRSDGWTLALHWGKSGGFYFSRGYTTVLCLGRLAFTWVPRDLHPMLRDLAGERWSAGSADTERPGAKKPGEPYRIAVDFDGVIHSYVSGWTGPANFPDPPVPGAVEWLEEMARSFEVIIFTTRGQYPEAKLAIREWLVTHGYRGPELRITNEKPAALVYLDDRAIRFEGVFPSKEEIHRARPWRVE